MQTASQKARTAQSEWEAQRGFTTQVRNNVRQECYATYEQFCRSIGIEPSSEMLYDYHLTRLRK